jgi:RimJ/RimL family protein N-acetyltransferase
VRLTGKYVSLRPITENDAEITQRWRTSGRAFLLNKGAQTVAEQAAWIARQPVADLNFIQELPDGTPVGMLSLIDIKKGRAEPGHFLIGEPEKVRGIPVAAEATRLLYELAFDKLRIHTLYGATSAENTRMIRWNTYLGYQIKQVWMLYYFIGDHWHDAVYSELTEKRYREITVPKLRGLIGF